MSLPEHTGDNPPCPPGFHVYAEGGPWITAAAEHIAGVAAESIKARGQFTLVLSGGTTPQPVYKRLASATGAGEMDWSRVHLFFGDERCVPPDDERSNYTMVRRVLLDCIHIPPANVHRIRGENEPERAAADYARELRRLLAVEGDPSRIPALDLVLLGLGEDGHTASLFPELTAVGETRRWVAAEYAPAAGMWRVTLTPVLINAARNVTFLVTGAGKAAILREVMEGPRRPESLPAQVVAPTHGALRWLVDAPAAQGRASRAGQENVHG